ncbi:WD40 repeat [Trypanosoma melophagium]|uniref:WD40 repeat n=1 Tax=Trypanosoma melophagium TaxID=715481 RepID=UPI00351AAC2D|nr:WD40 repeat [Trypanosoma melophagium]
MQRRTVSPGRGIGITRGRGVQGTAITRTDISRPNNVVRELHRNDGTNPRSARGRQIAHAMEDLMDEVYGGGITQPPPQKEKEKNSSLSPSETVNGGPYARFRTSFNASAVPKSWRSGPVDTSGRCFNASDRNLLCMDVHFQSKLCVVGSADHGLKVFDITTGREKRNLYTKNYGHTEWVTSCKFFQNSGQIISGGMDSKLCLWSATGPVRCSELLGHTGSISQVEVNNDNSSNIAMSSSYDRTLRVWDCSPGGAGGRCVATLAGHNAPVTMFAWCGTQVLSGDRRGAAKAWDVETGGCLATLAASRGQIGALWHLVSGGAGLLSAVGDQGGVLTVLDVGRTGSKPVYQDVLHPGGAVTGIRSIDETPYFITAGADKVILTLDPRAGFAPIHRFTDHRDFIYSLETFGPLILSGAGNGWLLVHDAIMGNCCYGLGANSAAVREIAATPTYLVAAGDDGNAMVYDYQ